MSLQSAVLLPERSAPADKRRRLAPVAAPQRRRRPRLVYALTALGGAALIAVAQIGLSLAITHDSFALTDLKSQQNTLSLQQESLQDTLAGVDSPQNLAASAASLGMVVAGSPSHLRLSDGAVLGSGEAAGSSSTVDPAGSGAVANALLQKEQAVETPSEEATPDATETTAPVDGVVETPPVTEDAAPDLPPALTEGLPSPTTH